MRLETVTLSGADDDVDPGRLLELQRRWPFVEFGLLWSYSREATPRYPSLGRVLACRDAGLPLAIHLCGAAADHFTLYGTLLDAFLDCRRLQLNWRNWPPDGPRALDPRREAILQVRGGPPPGGLGCFLALGYVPFYDRSGGRGQAPDAWPAHLGGGRCGFAGGLTPENVAAELTAMATAQVGFGVERFWIDVESGVRDAGDRFDLGRAEAFLAACAPCVGVDLMPVAAGATSPAGGA